MWSLTRAIDRAFVKEWSERYLHDAANSRWRPGPKLVSAMAEFPALQVVRGLASYWSLEDFIFSTIGPSVRDAALFTVAEFVTVGYWKTPRPLTNYLSNEARPGTIQKVTGAALARTEPAIGRRATLAYLNGVGAPVASALLTVWCPDEFTIIDYRALSTLSHFGATVDGVAASEHRQFWWEQHYELYLKLCKSIVETVAPFTLREVDRALWKWGERNG